MVAISFPTNSFLAEVLLLSNEIDRGTMDRLRILANGIATALDGTALAVP